MRLWVRLRLLRALVCEAAALDVRTNYAFKAVDRLNAAVDRLDLRTNWTCCWSLSSLIYGRMTYVRQAHPIVALLVPTPILVWGVPKFTASGAHDVIAITSPQKNDLCTEELRDKAKSLDEVSLPLRKARFGCLFIR